VNRAQVVKWIDYFHEHYPSLHVVPFTSRALEARRENTPIDITKKRKFKKIPLKQRWRAYGGRDLMEACASLVIPNNDAPTLSAFREAMFEVAQKVEPITLPPPLPADEGNGDSDDDNSSDDDNVDDELAFQEPDARKAVLQRPSRAHQQMMQAQKRANEASAASGGAGCAKRGRSGKGRKGRGKRRGNDDDYDDDDDDDVAIVPTAPRATARKAKGDGHHKRGAKKHSRRGSDESGSDRDEERTADDDDSDDELDRERVVADEGDIDLSTELDDGLPKLVTENDKRFVTIGMVGHPNVGKSSFINAMKGKKVVSTSRTPGHTKHFQTIFLNDRVRLCDCPGLVFPLLDFPRELQV